MKLQLFKGCKIKKNDVIEKTSEYDIMTYLGTLESESIDLNLNKRIFDDLTVTIKLNRKLKEIDVYSYNYAMIEYNNKRYFYFIANKDWVAENTTSFVLFLDTLNTFEYFTNIITDTDKWSKSNVFREHRNRFTKNKIPVIDKVDEGLGTLPMELKETKLLGSGDKYYLGYYKTGANDSSSGNERYHSQLFSSNGSSFDQTVNYFHENIGNLIPNVNDAILIYSDKNTLIYDKASDKNISFVYAVRGTSHIFYYKEGYFLTNDMIHFTESSVTDADVEIISSSPVKYIIGINNTGVSGGNSYSLYDLLGTTTVEKTSVDHTVITVIIKKFSDIVRADNKIVKLIEIPYYTRPIEGYDFFRDTTANVYYAGVDYLEDTINTDITFNSEDIYNTSLPSSLDNVLADKKYETKLLGSQFTTNMFKYDSFNYSLAAEDLTLPQTSFNITSYVTNDMSTTVAYKFDYKGTINNEFDRWLITQRNNQIPTMTNDYLDYMENGYNYDIKNRNIQTGLSWANFAMQAPISGFSIFGAGRNLV